MLTLRVKAVQEVNNNNNILHYGNDIVFHTGNKKIRHFLTTINLRKNPLQADFAVLSIRQRQ